ncbi:MAG: hypothetical protein AMXMBFR84_34570 [Candidatus Hydrogenedentota bacterium]
MSEHSPTTHKLFWKRRYIYIPTLSLLVLLIASFFDAPRRYLVTTFASRFLHADVRASGIGLSGEFSVERLSIQDRAENPIDALEPMIDVSRVSADYRLLPEDGRYLQSLQIDEIVLRILQAAASQTNYSFVKDVLSQPSSGRDVTPFLPKSTDIAHIDARFVSPYAAVHLSGLSLSGSVQSMENMRWTLSGSRFTGESSFLGDVPHVFEDGRVLVEISRDGNVFELNPVSIQVPGMTEFEGMAEVRTEDDRTVIHVDVPQGRVDGAFVSAVAPALLPVPIRMTELDLTDTQISGTLGTAAFGDWEGRVQMNASGFAVGAPGAVWFEGDLALDGIVKPGGEFDVTALVNGSKPIRATGSFEGGALETAIETGLWQQAEWEAVIPGNLLASIQSYTTIDTISATANVYTDGREFRIQSQILPEFEYDHGRMPVRVDLNGEGNVGGESGDFSGSVAMELNDGVLDLHFRSVAPDALSVTGRFDVIDPHMFASLFRPEWAAHFPHGALSGNADATVGAGLVASADLQFLRAASEYKVNAHVELASDKLSSSELIAEGFLATSDSGRAEFESKRDPESRSIQAAINLSDFDVAVALNALGLGVSGLNAAVASGVIKVGHASNGTDIDVNLSPSDVRYETWSIANVDPFTLQASIQLPEQLDAVQIRAANLTISEAVVLNISSGHVGLGNPSYGGQYSGRIDFDVLNGLIEPTGAVGALMFDIPLTQAGSRLASKVRLEGDGFGYGRWAGAYGKPLIVQAETLYDLDSKSGKAETVSVVYGDSTQVDLDAFQWATDPLGFSSTFTIDTSLNLLEDLRVLNKADGIGKWSGEVAWKNNALQVTARGVATAPVAVLPNDYAALGGLSMEGNMIWQDTLSGEGRFAIANVAAAGAVIHELSGTFEVQGGIMNVIVTGGTLYGGVISGTAQVDLVGENREGRMALDFDGVDLDQFTREYEPPQVVLTGLANGKVQIQWDRAGMTKFHAVLKSTEGFTMDKATIDTLLVTTVMQETRGLRFLTKGLRKDAIGDEPQRPFDSASMVIDLTGDSPETHRLEGPVKMLSKGLDLTIDLGVDIGAIYAGLELRQEAQLDQIDTITADPLQWGE